MRIRFCLLGICLAPLARSAEAQTSAAGVGDSGHAAHRATVTGVVYDSLSHRPLASARVQLVSRADPAAMPRTALADSAGRFSFAAVPPGDYTLGFLHSRLDALHIEPPQRTVAVAPGTLRHVTLAIPSAPQLRAALCGSASQVGMDAAITGTVRDAFDSTPLSAANVVVWWDEVEVFAAGARHRRAQRATKTGSDGWFALCDVPRDGRVGFMATHGVDSTDALDVPLPASGLYNTDVFIAVGLNRPPSLPDTTIRSGGAPQSSLRSGVPAEAAVEPRAGSAGGRPAGRVAGRVVRTAGRQPLGGALVRTAGGPQTRTDSSGAWVLSGVPPGTRRLEVRAVGYYPALQAITVRSNAALTEVPEIALQTLQSVLDTLRVTARRSGGGIDGGFERRRRSGAGRYLAPADILRHRPLRVSDLFRVMPGVRVEGQVWMRGVFGDCSPGLYIDHHYLGSLGETDVDSWVRPEELLGIEIYTEASVPPQFRKLPSGGATPESPCGSIVMWRR